MNAYIDALKAVLPKVPEDQKSFANSPVHQFDKRGTLSDKQWFWVQKLIDAVECAGVPDFTKEYATVGPMAGLIGLFAKAKQKLKYPAISLELPDGTPVELKISGEKSKTPGYVQVSDGGPWGANRWFGRVSPEGVWEKSKLIEQDAGLSASILALLTALSRSPAQTAAAHGKITGRCCFCNKGLEDAKSTAVGYGPVCAKHFGLPWGASVAKPVLCN